jgi:uncharacterized protein YoxC
MLVNDRQILELLLTKVTSIEDDVSALKFEVNKIGIDVNKLGTDVDKLGTTVDKLDNTVDVILAQTAKLSEYHNETLSILHEIREEHKSIKEMLVDHEITLRTLKRMAV